MILETQSPGLDARAIGPSELRADVRRHAFVVEELRLAIFLALGIEQAIALDGAVAFSTSGTAIEMVSGFFRADQHEHQ